MWFKCRLTAIVLLSQVNEDVRMACNVIAGLMKRPSLHLISVLSSWNARLNLNGGVGCNSIAAFRGMQNLAAIKQLRKVTNAGVVECKEALSRCNGDLDAAIAYVRRAQHNRQLEIDTERPVFGMFNFLVPSISLHVGKIAIPSDIRTREKSVIVELCCNCDFVTSSDKFAQLAHDIRRTIQRSIDNSRINVTHSNATKAAAPLDIGSCNDIISDGDDGLTVSQMLQRSSAEFKTKIVMPTVIAFQRNLRNDHVGIYVHQKTSTGEGVMGSILGLVSLRHHGVNATLSNHLSDTLGDIARHLAIQMVCNPLNTEQWQTEEGRPYRMADVNHILQQPWMHLDSVQSKMHDIATKVGLGKCDIDSEASVGRTLDEIAKLIGAASITVPGALYMKSGATPVICD
ncbi:ELONGATION FACTOR TS, putative [Babesia bigemina]|uniref:ELONGATION FACTOR TS, putative n=1 Tax=Babesia bigemina TaxID=5866 RepID=A0A061D9R3_BABBI|nr:ELONGATION FACTOR TS, putative [Babesia bigemina]CDR97431.1 ELONGATION FACTOR TS, putative [Babesia bigemina]|eukprot:XP_012769617.1 ELONGATION FACTOR TS, putative [Babesia bigemina]